MNLLLTRYAYGPFETEGALAWEGAEQLWTIEQPWQDEIDGTAYAAGAPYHSCIPEGDYRMEPFTRPDGQKTWVLDNPDLGVFAGKGDREATWQRFLCLFHKGNFVGDVEGCILPGLSCEIMLNGDTGKQERAVASSASAMQTLRDTLGELSEGHTLQIVQERGALYGGE
jgi:hypothetical protein